MKPYLPIATICLLLCASACGVFKKSEKGKVEYITEPITEEQTIAKRNETDQRRRLRGEWTVMTASGYDITNAEKRPYIDFNPADGKIYGNTGCNIINADFDAQGDNSIRISKILTTERFCHEYNLEQDIINGLGRAASFSIYKKDGLYYLDLNDSTGVTVMHLKRHNADVASGLWLVKSIYRKNVADQEIELVIDIPERRLYGTTGCNLIDGTIGIDRNKDWFIQFQGIKSTNKQGSEKEMHNERNLLVALEEVEYINRINNHEIKLTDKDGNEVLMLKRITPDSNR